jgi:transposase
MSSDLVPPPNSGISPEDWQQTPESVRVWITVLGAEIKQLTDTVEKLQEIARRNSQNSSQPPSQDRPDQKPIKEKPSQPRWRGGQPHHRGHHRLLVELPDEIIQHKPVSCRRCGALLLGEDAKPYRHQVTELPIVKARVVEHQVHRLTCPCCGLINRMELPRDVATSQSGVNVMSLIGLLMGRYRLSKRQVAQLMGECFGIELAASTVVNHQKTLSQALAEPVAELLPYIQSQPSCNVDETSWRQVGQLRRSWLWTVVTRYATLFRIVPSRGSQVARELLGENYMGVAGTDRYSAYTWLVWRQFCWSHLLRDFQKILERGEDSYRVGWNLKLQAEYLLVLWARVREGALSYANFMSEFPAVQALIRSWLTAGSNATSARTAATCRQLLDGDASLWLFATKPDVEPTNNSAERALRHPVIWRRTSHGTQSDPGSQFVERILSVVETCRQQQRPVFDFLRQALLAYRAGQPAPSLLPALQP